MKFGFEDLEVWHLALELIDEVYDIADKFPAMELYNLTSQVRRAAISISLNIAEGSGRHHKRDFARFIRLSIGSLLEVVASLKIAIRRNYLTQGDYEMTVSPLFEKLYFKLIALEKSLLT